MKRKNLNLSSVLGDNLESLNSSVLYSQEILNATSEAYEKSLKSGDAIAINSARQEFVNAKSNLSKVVRDVEIVQTHLNTLNSDETNPENSTLKQALNDALSQLSKYEEKASDSVKAVTKAAKSSNLLPVGLGVCALAIVYVIIFVD